ncbi:MAG TPA: hypothetical protein VHV26_00580, partial [Rhizomicrobium sp.]|nr:hypothetical protein [Rhizomicrobium sp.]
MKSLFFPILWKAALYRVLSKEKDAPSMGMDSAPSRMQQILAPCFALCLALGDLLAGGFLFGGFLFGGFPFDGFARRLHHFLGFLGLLGLALL